ncbi:MAG: hypothetical protein GY826_38365 [Fuerstiella sp.]|nr:hypothetical protein [Fuerstiella sp.]
MVFVHPDIHTDVKDAEIPKKDQMQLDKAVLLRHASTHPECLISCAIPENPGTATKDPGFEAVKLLVDNESFPVLRKMLQDSSARNDINLVGQLQELVRMKESGQLSQDQYDAAVNALTRQS